MNLLTREDLRELIEVDNSQCVSILMPTHRGAESRQDKIRLDNLIKSVQEQLIAGGARTNVAQEMLQPARRLLDDSDFWRNTSRGLAIYIAPGFTRIYRLALDLPAQADVQDRFAIKPLLPLLAGGGRYFVLAISKRAVKLLDCTSQSQSEISLVNAPLAASMQEALKYDLLEKQVQFHQAAPAGLPGAGRGRVIFHANAGYDMSVEKDLLKRFLLEVDRGVAARLKDEKAPLIFAGVEYLFGIYQIHNSYGNLAGRAVEGNPDQLHDSQLRERAWQIAEPMLLDVQRQAMGHYERAMSYGMASDNIHHVVTAAYDGRVGAMFVRPEHSVWGTFDPASKQVRVHEVREEGDVDLVDLATVQTLLNGGLVYSGHQGLQPEGTTVAAIYRY